MSRYDIQDKTALMDASSAIILCKAGLHKVVAEMYNVVMPGSVYKEITANSYPGAEEYRQLMAGKKITLKEPLPDTANEPVRPGLNSLDRGEHDVLQLYYAGQGNFIVTDDGAAAKYCKRERIPFVNALLVPVILGFAKIKDEYFCRESMKKIIEIGRYSPGIISFAEKCETEDLSFFIPKKIDYV